jgi:nickel transport protein
MRKRATRKNFLKTAAIAAVLLLSSGRAVFAHGVSVFAWVEGETVHVESAFSGGRKPVGASVEVYDARGSLLLKGATDVDGKFSFPMPQRTEMKIILLAGMGHRAEWTIRAGEEPPRSDSPISPPTIANDPSVLIEHPLSEAEIRGLLEETLDRKLQPIYALLAESRQRGPSTTEIFGGIGYVFGLIGIAAYVHSRRRPVR